jgi:hypothetical protein
MSWKRFWKNWLCRDLIQVMLYPDIASQDSHCPGQESNRVPPEYSPEVLLLDPGRSVVFFFYKGN